MAYCVCGEHLRQNLAAQSLRAGSRKHGAKEFTSTFAMLRHAELCEELFGPVWRHTRAVG